MSLRIWIFQTGEPIHSDNGSSRPMRAMNLADLLISRDHKVSIWTSAFYHQERIHRSHTYKVITINPSLDIHLIPSRGYAKNISLSRLFDHAILGFNLYRALRRQLVLPDIGFVGYPPIEFALFAVMWLKKRNVPVLVDCKDQWPQIFVNSVPWTLKPLAILLLAPYFLMGKKTLQNASGISSISLSFLEWALSYADRPLGEFDSVFPLAPIKGVLSSEMTIEAEAWWGDRGISNAYTVRFIFVGSLSQAFNFKPILIAAKLAIDRGLDWQFVICGAGEQIDYLRLQSKSLGNVILPGWINRAQYEALAIKSTAALAPYRDLSDFRMSIPNKILDYLSFGLPIISPLKGEVESLIRDEGLGLYYEDDIGSESCFDCLFEIATKPKLRKEISDRAQYVFQHSFDGNIVYEKFANKLEYLAVKKSAPKIL